MSWILQENQSNLFIYTVKDPLCNTKNMKCGSLLSTFLLVAKKFFQSKVNSFEIQHRRSYFKCTIRSAPNFPIFFNPVIFQFFFLVWGQFLFVFCDLGCSIRVLANISKYQKKGGKALKSEQFWSQVLVTLLALTLVIGDVTVYVYRINIQRWEPPGRAHIRPGGLGTRRRKVCL